MKKVIDGYRYSMNTLEGDRYVRVRKDNKIYQEYIGKHDSNGKIRKRVVQIIKEMEKMNPLTDREKEITKRNERGFYQVLAEDKGIVFDPRIFYKYAIRIKRTEPGVGDILCDKKLYKELEQEIIAEDEKKFLKEVAK